MTFKETRIISSPTVLQFRFSLFSFLCTISCTRVNNKTALSNEIQEDDNYTSATTIERNLLARSDNSSATRENGSTCSWMGIQI